MFFGYSVLLIASGFLTQVPPALQALLLPTNEISGTFVQTKTVKASDRTVVRHYTTYGPYRLQPGIGFEWKTLEPFETRFYATPTNYVYSNEDESVSRPLSDLPGFSNYADLMAKRDASPLLKAFETLYKEEDGRFYLKSKPKDGRLRRVLSRIEAEGTPTNWFMRAEFPTGDAIRLEFKPAVEK